MDVLAPPGADGAVLELVEVTYADGGSERYALPLRHGRECAAADPLWPALARAAGVEAGAATAFVALDISNTLVALGDDAVLKLYRRPEPGPHPEAELLAALDGLHAPRLLGRLEHAGETLLVVQARVEGEQVGWERLISRLAGGDEATGEPAELATVTAALHKALAERLGTTPAPSPAAAGHEPPTGGERLDPRVEAALAPLARPSRSPLQRVHGDLHVAQFLRTADGLVVVDWEGEPGLSLEARARPRPALRDLATLRLSLAHAARAAARRNPAFDWHEWSVRARDEALDAYAALAGPADGQLLHALEVEKELTELEYARRWLPEWEYVPRDVLPVLLEEAP